MAHFDIISSQGQHPVIWSGAPKYVGAYLKPGYLEFPAIGSPTPLSWHVGDYVVYSRTGKTYRLYRTPQAVEQGLSNKYGASFLYENVQFFDDSKQLEFCPFTDLVPGDNTVHFSTQNVVSFFGKPANVAERIQACLEAQYGAGTWEVRVVTTSDADLLEILNTEIEFSVTGANCQEVLDKVYEQWNGLGWIHTVENGKNVITIGASNVRTNANTTVPFAFDNGLVRVERSIANADQIGTRLFAYGSMKNMDATYYRGLDIKDAESVDIEHLMIPIANWGITDGKPDARKAYIENATAIASLGLIPRTAYFDGSGDLPDIHPTIERMTIGEVYDAGGAGYVPDLSKWSRSDRIDELVSAVNPSDHGTSADQGQKYIETLTGNVAAVTRGFSPDEEVSIGIYYATVVHAGNASLRFGQNSQALQITGSWTPAFNLSILISAGNIKKEIPIVPTQVSSSEWSFILPESVSFGKVSAGATISVSIVGFVSGSASSSDAVALVTDSGTSAETSVEHEIDKTFTVRIPQLGFDIEKYAELGNGKILSMKTGMCGARDFEIKDVRYVASADAWDLTLYRSVDEGLNIMFPNADYQIASGDQFVLLDIAMPEMYVTVASSRLLAAAQKLLADISSEKPFYNPQVDAKVVYNEGRILREGMWMGITQEGNQEYCLIDSITIDENGSNIPTYEVALREKKGIDWTENVGKSGSSKSSVSVKGGEEVKTNGTVTSVGMTAPTGLEVEGSPITGTGVLKLKLASGYKIPLESELAPYFEQDDQIATLVKLKEAYSYLGPRKGLIFDSILENDTSDADLYVKWVGEGTNRQRVLYSPLALITGGDQIVGSGTPGGGGGGDSKYLNDLLDVTITNPSNGQALVYQNGEWVNGSAIPDLSDYYTKTQTDTAISSAITALNLGAAATYSIGSVASGNTGLVTGGSVYSAINSALTSVLKLVGVTTTEISDGSTTNPVIINGSSYTAVTGNVVLYGAKEYLWTGSAWEEMGDEASWALKTITITAGTGLTGGGTLEANRTISLSDATIASLALADSAYQKPAGGIPNSDLANSWVKVGTTQINLGGQQTSLAGLVNVTMSGKLKIGSAEIVWVAGTGGAPGYLKINSALLTDGDQIVGGGTPGGGGTGGQNYLKDLYDISGSVTAKPSADSLLVYSTTGTDKNGGSGAWEYNTLNVATNKLINSLTVGTSTPVDDDYYVSQYANGGTTTTTYHRRKVSVLYAYIKNKLAADNIYLPLTAGASNPLTGILSITNSAVYSLYLSNTTSGATQVGIRFRLGGTTNVGALYCNSSGEFYNASNKKFLTEGNFVAGTNYVTPHTTIAGYGITDAYISSSAVTIGTDTVGSSAAPIGYATQATRLKGYVGTADNGGYDLNTMLSGGGITSQYSSRTYWANGPTGMRYGGVAQFNTQSTDILSLQLAWDVVHDSTAPDTGNLWFRDKTSINSGTWGGWKQIYHSGNFNPGNYLPLAGGTMTGALKMSYAYQSGANFKFINNRAVSGGSGWADPVFGIYNAAESFIAGIGICGNADALSYLYIGSNGYNGVNLRINSSSIKWGDNDILHAGNYSSYALPLSAGSSYPLTGDLYLTAGKGIEATGGAGLLVYHPATDTWAGVSNTQWAVGATDSQGVIRSGNNNLLHYRNGTNYDIWDKYNAGTSTTPWTCSALSVAYNSYIHLLDSGNASDLGYIRWFNGTDGSTVRLASNGIFQFYTGSTLANRLTINASGNVGISNTSPSYKLDVAGTIGLSDGSLIMLGKGMNAIYLTQTSINWHNTSNTWASSLIGFESANIKLQQTTTHSGGHIYLTGSQASSSTGNTTQIVFGTSSSNHVAISSNTDAVIINPTTSTTTGQIILGVNSTTSSFGNSVTFKGADNRFESATWNNVKIKRTTSGGAWICFYPSNQETYFWDVGASGVSSNSTNFSFEYQGNGVKAYLTPTGTFSTVGDQVISSDINLKTHLEPVKYTIEDIAKTRAVTFDWKDGRGKSAGSIAQDWKPLIPELVHGEEGNMTLAYGQIALINSILLAKHETEQDKEIKKLKARVRNLEKQLKMRS